ncbi:FAS1-like dehydratase domain-containing protein [Desulfotruncus alcoholivorax]|uniref:FAS1-like dehydratase domain-containing protein n=1 Tax=Desulfotruncus alcoholivorax TaxID=265477 RepID=UPI000407DA03|nr:MaoC family dehydratase N-terminal domain-containing protein [Desulfotruncus alcoholivorax]
MSDRNSLVDTELSRHTFTVERGKIRELALAIGDDNPVYTDPEYARSLGYRDVIAPPTFGTCIDLWGGLDFMELCRKLQLNPVNVLHGGQDYEYYGAIYPGDVIEACSVLKKQLHKSKMSILILETTYRNQNGDTVLTCRKTIIERGQVQ